MGEIMSWVLDFRLFSIHASITILCSSLAWSVLPEETDQHYIYIYISILYIYILYRYIYISITYFPLSSEVLLGLINERTRNKKAGENRGKVLLPESGTTVLAGSAFLSHGHSISQNICPS